jgi:hypothetical protein
VIPESSHFQDLAGDNGEGQGDLGHDFVDIDCASTRFHVLDMPQSKSLISNGPLLQKLETSVHDADIAMY